MIKAAKKVVKVVRSAGLKPDQRRSVLTLVDILLVEELAAGEWAVKEKEVASGE